MGGSSLSRLHKSYLGCDVVFIALDALEAGSPGEFVGHFAPEGVSEEGGFESEAIGGIADAVGAAHGVNEGDERVGFAAAVLGAEADDGRNLAAFAGGAQADSFQEFLRAAGG